MITDNFKQKVSTVCSCLSRDVDFFNVVLSYQASFSMPFYEPSTGHYQRIFGEYNSITPKHLGQSKQYNANLDRSLGSCELSSVT